MSPGEVTIAELSRRLGYSGPVEYLTMWLCLFLTPTAMRRCRSIRRAGLAGRFAELAAAELRSLTTTSVGVPVAPHPERLMTAVAAKLSS